MSTHEDNATEAMRKAVALQISQLHAIYTDRALRKLRDNKHREGIKKILDESGGISALADEILTDEEKDVARKMRELGATQKARGNGRLRLPWRMGGATHNRLR